MTAFTHRRPLRQSFILLALLLVLASWLVLQKRAAGSVNSSKKPQHEQANTVPIHQAGFDSTRLRGVSWVGGDSITAADLKPLVRAHVTWLAQMPFGWQDGAASPAIHTHSGGGSKRFGMWGESDQGLIYTALLAKQHGINTLLKPHLWVRGRGTWPGDINMSSAADWQAWFASYTTFILHYAEVAETAHMAGLCLGTELQHATEPTHEKAWRQLIKRVRQVYHGQLTYAANWSGEYQQIRFWDALDFVGIQAYFPLSAEPNPPLDTLLRGWQPHLRALAAFQKKVKKPLVFTEIGYKTTADAAARPWEWPERAPTATPADEATQARCYEALFRACWGQLWLKGLFIWKWYPGLAADSPARRHADFTPQHKPAEAVLGRWFAQ